MRFMQAKPFVRYTQKITLLPTAQYKNVCPCDNRLFFCVDGEGAIQTQDKCLVMRAGAFLLLPAGSMYRLIAPKTAVTYLVVNFDYTSSYLEKSYPIVPVAVENFKENDIVERVFFEDEPALNQTLYLQKIHMVENKLLRLLSGFSKKPLYYETEISALLLQVLGLALRAYQCGEGASTDEILEKIVAYIRENFQRDIDNGDIANALGYHPHYVGDLFKQATGTSLHQYVIRLRLERAIELIELGEKSIGEIAEECGFYDLYHFSKVFKRVVGVSPSAYRR